jgi:hypothetical protein
MHEGARPADAGSLLLRVGEAGPGPGTPSTGAWRRLRPVDLGLRVRSRRCKHGSATRNVLENEQRVAKAGLRGGGDVSPRKGKYGRL